MPNRIIKESIWDSPSIDKLSALAERHFYRLLPLPDDFGCFQATASVVKGRLYPLKTTTAKQINRWHAELEAVGICKFWQENGRIYGVFVNWSKHQRIRSLHQRKTPEPPKVIKKLDWFAVTCRQVSSNDRLNPNPNPNPIKSKDGGQKRKSSAQNDPIQKEAEQIVNRFEKKVEGVKLNYGIVKNMLMGQRGFEVVSVGDLERLVDRLVADIKKKPLADPLTRFIDMARKPAQYLE